MTQANSYPTGNQGYQQSNNQSVYSASTGLNNNSFTNPTAASGQYNSYNSSNSHKLVKDSTFESSAAVVSTSVTVTTNNTVSSTPLSHSQVTASGTKSTTTLGVYCKDN